MILSDSFELSAPLEAVWEFLQDIPKVSACVPGAEAVEETQANVYRGVLKVQVGPIKSAFSGKVTLLERVPLQRLSAVVEGDDKNSATRVKATFSASLSQGENGTRVSYKMDVALRGRLAQFGATIVKATARKMTGEFARCVQAALSATTEE